MATHDTQDQTGQTGGRVRAWEGVHVCVRERHGLRAECEAITNRGHANVTRQQAALAWE